jgi:hypothetical protein
MAESGEADSRAGCEVVGCRVSEAQDLAFATPSAYLLCHEYQDRCALVGAVPCLAPRNSGLVRNGGVDERRRSRWI